MKKNVQQPKPSQAETKQAISFAKLYKLESATLDKQADKSVDESEEMAQVQVTPGTGGEPWVNFTPKDRLGLALSGGGIRSATFNLGLLQSLDQLGVLEHVDYLATVSGGGYVGGFWTAWLKHKKDKSDEKTAHKKFPSVDEPASGECAEVRHLREFSRFLLPCISVLGTEFWGILMTVLGGLLPSLVAALSVLVLMWFGWVVVLLGLLAGENNAWITALMIVLAGGYFILSEKTFGKRAVATEAAAGGEKLRQSNLRGYTLGIVVACVLLTSACMFSRKILLTTTFSGHEILAASVAMLKEPAAGFYPAMMVSVVALLALVLRALIARFFRSTDGANFLLGYERAATRLLRLAAIMLGLAALWWLAGKLQNSTHGYYLKSAGGSAALSTGLFLWARKWLSEPPKETHGGNLLWLALGWLKRATPKVLATITWLLFFVLVGVSVHWWLQRPATPDALNFWWLPGGSIAIILLMIGLYDPERMGMHELYRSRIARCYLGASNPHTTEGKTEGDRAARNRVTSEHPDDDMTLADLQKISRPLHLVCTAANDLSGEPVGTLYRGAKSAVLSANGISVGDSTAQLNKLRLSSALTASAAAFNSQMGRYSMDLGPAVTFLMTAFNLRLGLWVPHPDTQHRWELDMPGLFFFWELFGISKADGRHLLLSDGGHFENFGVYELIRRHCRYIIVSDCGADPEVAFDDLANVLRRVREDFGVEVELDVSRLNPGVNGFASQHAVVGTIHYNGLGGMDKGSILFVKPAITGDEPPDVLQYRTRNLSFPHESTANQFYDEPQWESYRRLGAHSGRVVFEFLDKPEMADASVDNIFRSARSFWYALPENLSARFIEMSARCAEFGSHLSAEGPLQLRREFFSELGELAKTPPEKPEKNPTTDATPDDELKVLEYLIRVVQMMEDVWVSGDLERYYSHPLNEGWMNYFHRWASTPSFRRWWPVLAPIYSFHFRNFVQERFGIGCPDAKTGHADPDAATTAKLDLIPLGSIDDAEKLGALKDYLHSNAWRFFKQSRHELAKDVTGKKIFGYVLRLLDRHGRVETAHLWVGFVLVQESPAEQMAHWHATDFFVPQMLHGGNIVSNLLDALIRHYRKNSANTIQELRVHFGPKMSETVFLQSPHKLKEGHKSQGLAPAARYERVREIEFYKSRGFHYHRPEDTSTGAISLHLELTSTHN